MKLTFEGATVEEIVAQMTDFLAAIGGDADGDLDVAETPPAAPPPPAAGKPGRRGGRAPAGNGAAPATPVMTKEEAGAKLTEIGRKILARDKKDDKLKAIFGTFGYRSKDEALADLTKIPALLKALEEEANQQPEDLFT